MNFVQRVAILGFVVFSCNSLFGAFDPRNTRQIIIDIDSTATQCCADIENNFIGTFTELESLIDQIEGLGCLRTSISQVDVGTTGFVITSSGHYQLIENVVFNPVAPAAAITINADFVSLDLQCFSITQGNATPDVDGIAVNANFDSIEIKNGSVDSMSRAGINIGSGVSNIVIDSTSLSNNLLGLDFNGSLASPISNYSISMVDLLANSTGGSFLFSNRGFLVNCVAQNNTSAGLEFISSFSNNVNTCVIENTHATVGSAFAISAITGGNNGFKNCIVDGVSTNDTFSGNTATGIFIGATENTDLILNNEISNCFTTSNAQPFGIQMAYAFTTVSSAGLPSKAAGTGAEWAPNNAYITNGGSVTIPTAGPLKFTNNKLMRVNQTTPLMSAWSPDGSRLFILSSGVFVEDFSGARFTDLATLANPGSPAFADWAPNGKYFAASYGSGSIILYNYSAGVITVLTSIAATNPTEIDFRYDSNYFANILESPNTINVYNVQNLSFILVATLALTNPEGIAWSPNGQFLATVSGSAGTSLLSIYRFTGTSLVLVTSINTSAFVTAPTSVTWSPDGQYLGVGGTAGTVDVAFYQFTQNSLIFLTSFTDGNDGAKPRWAPNGATLFVQSSTGVIRIVSGLVFPSNHVIEKNIIHGVHGPALSAGEFGQRSGRGLSASSGENLIIKNKAFDNDANYVFVTDVFEQFLYNVRNPTIPSLITNLSFPPL